MGFDGLIIKTMLELITPPMAFLKWYLSQHENIIIGISEDKWKKLNKWERIITPLRYPNPQDGHSYMQGDMIIEGR